MGYLELFFIAVGLSMDAFAVSVSAGLSIPKGEHKKSIIVGLYFGAFQALMPIAGFLAGSQFAGKISSFSNWISFALLCFIGGKMIYGCLPKHQSKNDVNKTDTTDLLAADVVKNHRKMLALSVATSIDALAAGVSFSFHDVKIIPAVSLIGIVTFTFSFAGTKVGAFFGEKFKSKAEFAGGAILIIIGFKILLESLL